MSKLVAAVLALKLVDEGVLSLDAPVDEKLKGWKSASSPLTDGSPVTLRWLLSMRAGLNVPGFSGYPKGAKLPTVQQILAGTPPALSPPVHVTARPGTTYVYSGGGYEVVEALIADATGRPFAELAKELVFDPLHMSSSVFAVALPDPLLPRVATGHTDNGIEIAGGWRALPELAAAGLWSTTNDLARLLISISAGYRGQSGSILARGTVQDLLTPQRGGPYGLGAAIAGTGQDLALMKRGQNVGYQGYLLLFPARGDGLVVLSGSDSGSILADALIRRALELYGWPRLWATTGLRTGTESLNPERAAHQARSVDRFCP